MPPQARAPPSRPARAPCSRTRTRRTSCSSRPAHARRGAPVSPVSPVSHPAGGGAARARTQDTCRNPSARMYAANCFSPASSTSPSPPSRAHPAPPPPSPAASAPSPAKRLRTSATYARPDGRSTRFASTRKSAKFVPIRDKHMTQASTEAAASGVWRARAQRELVSTWAPVAHARRAHGQRRTQQRARSVPRGRTSARSAVRTRRGAPRRNQSRPRRQSGATS